MKAELRDNFEHALADGVFAAPTLVVGDELFWGDDAHDFALAYLRQPTLMDDAQMARLQDLPIGV